MMKPGQFTLRHFFLETLCIAAALGCFTQGVNSPDAFQLPLVFSAAIFAAGAIGGAVGKMRLGFLVAAVALGAIVLIGGALAAVSFLAHLAFHR
jgi:hypothetical protein